MRHFLVIAALALTIPSLAVAAKPPAPGNSQNSQGKAPQVLYVLKGTITQFANPGTVVITVLSSNHYRSALKNQSLQLTVTASTKISVAGGGTVTAGHKGIVKVRAPKTLTNLVASLTGKTAFQVIDQGTSA